MHEEARLIIADSFRVREDDQIDATDQVVQVRGWRHHTARFRAAVADTIADANIGLDEVADTSTNAKPSTNTAANTYAKPGCAQNPTPENTDAFITDAAARIAEFGAGFPRLELWQTADGGSASPGWELRLSLRALPELRDSIAGVVVPGVALSHPRQKGRNIAALSELNASVSAEALLLTPAGQISEGATTSVLWWDADTLCRSALTERVPSVTERLVCDAAIDAGYRVDLRALTLELLHGHPMWAVNALHGIRPFTHIDGAPIRQHADPHRLAQFQAALDTTWEPVSPASTVA